MTGSLPPAAALGRGSEEVGWALATSWLRLRWPARITVYAPPFEDDGDEEEGIELAESWSRPSKPPERW